MNINEANDAWILHREDISTLKEGHCNVYVLLEASSGYCFGMETSKDLPTKVKISELLQSAHKKANKWPKQILISQ